ncbi:MAG: DUF1957 domain-containing protein [Elusimicrobia bacterium]|nr:DUF1957 domain-containing protein [Elusimicrobiota bacterium]
MKKGYLCLVLHAHLPFVRHPEYEDFLEEDWLFEAITETYIPLILMMQKLTEEDVFWRLTMSITPPLANMLSDELLQKRYLRYLSNLENLIKKEIKRTMKIPQLKPVVEMYKKRFRDCRKVFESCDGNILKIFKEFQEKGFLEIITCTATHGFLPLMVQKKDQQAQIKIAKRDYEEKFSTKPRGIWLAECGYTEGIDEILKEEKIRFFFTDTHGVLYGRPRPKYAVYAPVYTKEGVAVFARDVESSMQVWSAEVGYPGDYRYREFYRDLGFDLPYNYIRPHLHSDGIRRNVGIKYHRITGRVPLNKKEYYVPQWAQEAALTHARHFMWCRERQSEWLYSQFEREPVIVCPYDAELYGHWWFEGPDFLYYLFKELQNSIVEPVSPSQYLKKHPHLQVLEVCPSTWGDKGYNEVWLNGTNDWIYRHLHFCVEKMIESAQNYNSANPNKIEQRVLNQMARELLLAESSDWAFIMTTGTTVPYAHKRTKTHTNNFLKLYEMLKKGKIDENFLKDLEHRNNIFPHINWRVYA